MSHYIASKMGIIGFMRGLANDVANDGITANAVLPGLTNTLAIAPQSEEQKRATWEHQAIKRLAEPEDITGAILFLTSDDAIYHWAGNRCRRRSVSYRLSRKSRPKAGYSAVSKFEPKGIVSLFREKETKPKGNGNNLWAEDLKKEIRVYERNTF